MELSGRDTFRVSERESEIQTLRGRERQPVWIWDDTDFSGTTIALLTRRGGLCTGVREEIGA